jgi:multicomponent Na+:H+ antiporter subunit D
MQHLKVLPVIVPLLGAPLALLVQRPAATWLVAMAAALGAFAASVMLLMQVSATGVVSYELGGWAPPLGIEFRIDTINSFVLLLVSIIACVVLVFAPQSVAKELPRRSLALFYTAFLLCFAGLLGMAATGDAFNLFVFLEISSLASYILIALGGLGSVGGVSGRRQHV